MKKYVDSIVRREAHAITKSLLKAERRFWVRLKTTRSTGKNAPENFAAIAAPSASPVTASNSHECFSSPFQKKYKVNSMKTARGTSVVTRTP